MYDAVGIQMGDETLSTTGRVTSLLDPVVPERMLAVVGGCLHVVNVVVAYRMRAGNWPDPFDLSNVFLARIELDDRHIQIETRVGHAADLLAVESGGRIGRE